MLGDMTAEAKDLLASAAASAAHENRRSIYSADVAFALMSSASFDALFDAQCRSEIMKCLKEIPGDESVFGMPVDVYVYSDPVKRILAYALEEAQRSGERKLRPRHLLVGLLLEKECVAASLFQSHGIDVARVRAIR